jgi:hypothetical protein
MELINVDIDFFDTMAISLSGITGPLPTKASVPSSTVPAVGDLMRFPGLNFQTGDLAIFRVKLRTFLVGNTPRIQLNLELVASFPQLLAEE